MLPLILFGAAYLIGRTTKEETKFADGGTTGAGSFADGGTTDVVYSVGEYDTINGFTSKGGSKSGYPVYARKTGYPTKTLYVYQTKKQALAKVESLNKNKK